MEHDIHLSDDEARLLAAVLLSECEETHEELRRTENQMYKEEVQARFNLLERMLSQVQRSLQTLNV